MMFKPFLEFFRPRPTAAKAAAPETDPFHTDHHDDAVYGLEPLRILISPFAGDAEGLAARHIHDRLSGRMGVALTVSDRGGC